MTSAQNIPDEITPVDDVRRVRERIAREADGNIEVIAAQATAAFEKYRGILNLKLVPAQKSSADPAV